MPKLDYKKYSMDGKEYEPVTIYDAQNCIAIESKEEFCIVSKLHLLKLISRVCEIKSVNRHSMISDGTVSSWNELAALVYITSI